jgi:ubiquinone biosynthesis protein Coq4
MALRVLIKMVIGNEVNTLLKLNIECMYYNIDDMHKLTKECAGYMYTAIHLNIHSLPSK